VTTSRTYPFQVLQGYSLINIRCNSFSICTTKTISRTDYHTAHQLK